MGGVGSRHPKTPRIGISGFGSSGRVEAEILHPQKVELNSTEIAGIADPFVIDVGISERLGKRGAKRPHFRPH